MDEGSELYAFAPDATLLVMCVNKLRLAFQDTPEQDREAFAERVMEQIGQYWDTLAARFSRPTLQFNFPYENDGVMGSYALRDKASFPYQLQSLNCLLSRRAAETKNVYLVDLNGLQGRLGRDVLMDDALYYAAKLAFSIDALPAVAGLTVDAIQALRGRVHKAVVLDLDNTLWGGVIGDDGLEGIQIGELGIGHAYTEMQLWLKELKKRGILLAVCSKNNEATAKEPFLHHPEMTLRLEDFVLFVANWEDKASNIRLIQNTLNIGMDSLVFIDDNPFERNQVREAIPEITVPELPADPALYLRYLQGLNLFETAALSANDGERTAQNRTEAERTSLLSAYASYDEYLQKLDMRAVAAPFDAFHYPRIAQLTQRSNQFNLRTVRYTEAQVEALAQDSRYITRYYTLRDRFGDYGLISVVVLERQPGDVLFVTEWLMSCRVLKRGMEEFIVNDMLALARADGCRQVVGEYIPTPKNAMVADLYTRMGFTGSGARFTADVNAYQAQKTWIEEEEQ